ncbi:MAG TPA: 4-(cytidine 5'-diphospho)-2-C-methyl-D-erythritol kinase, partial [Clostridia bacterium]|nr:4-(cytidine 5'-diphospho)-2-C-methyl-D-erythritol kinase [Clostridia bacterium]
DRLEFARADQGITLTCSEPGLPVDSRNLVYRAATAFLQATGLQQGVRIHLEKRIPMAAGLGGGSGNAATALLGLNELFGHVLPEDQMQALAGSLGSDVPFFLQDHPALASGRGEKIESLPPFACLQGKAFLLIHPGFGIATAWAYKELARFPSALNGKLGRARILVEALAAGDVENSASCFYNSLEAPALEKYPILALFQEFLKEHGALAAMMSGSGSTTFAIAKDLEAAQTLGEKFKARFGAENWIRSVPI